MKCEVKCIKNDLKEDCRALGLGNIFIVLLISIVVTATLREILGEFIYNCISMAISLVILLYFAFLGYFVWKDATDYCSNRKTKAQINSPGDS